MVPAPTDDRTGRRCGVAVVRSAVGSPGRRVVGSSGRRVVGTSTSIRRVRSSSWFNPGVDSTSIRRVGLAVAVAFRRWSVPGVDSTSIRCRRWSWPRPPRRSGSSPASIRRRFVAFGLPLRWRSRGWSVSSEPSSASIHCDRRRRPVAFRRNRFSLAPIRRRFVAIGRVAAALRRRCSTAPSTRFAGAVWVVLGRRSFAYGCRFGPRSGGEPARPGLGGRPVHRPGESPEIRGCPRARPAPARGDRR